jgi:hypothetical protein
MPVTAGTPGAAVVGDAWGTVVMVEVDETDAGDDSSIDVPGAWFPEQAVNTRSATHRRIPLTVLSRTA